MIDIRLTSANLIGFLLVLIVEYSKNQQKNKLLEKEELRIKNRKEWCVFAGLVLMLVFSAYFLIKIPIIMIITVIGFLAYCFSHFLKTIYYSLKNNSDDSNVDNKEIIIAQIASIYLLSIMQNFVNWNAEMRTNVSEQLIIIIAMLIGYSVNIFFVLNDIHILLSSFIVFLKNNQKFIKIENKINQITEKIFKFDVLENGYDRTYKNICSIKNKIIKFIILKIQFVIYIIIFSFLSFVYLFFVYPLNKVREFISLIDKFITDLIEKIWKSYKMNDLYRYSRVAIILSMLIVYVIVNNDENITMDVRNIYEFAVTVILIPIIVESLMNIKKTKNIKREK